MSKNEKNCNSCLETKLLEDFYFHRTRNHYVSVCKECDIARRVLHQKNNKEGYRKRWAEWSWRPEVREKIRATAREQYYKNKDRVRFAVLNRIARNKNANGTHTAAEIRAMLVAQSSLCVACKADISHKFHVDHVVPLVCGGDNDISNIQLLCPTCNMRKGKKSMDEFKQLLGANNAR